MNKTQEDIVSSTKEQVVAICDDLAQHTSKIDQLISDEGPVDNLVIQGHIEAHLEKVEDSLFAICSEYEISESRFSETVNADQYNFEPKARTQRQGMKLLSQSIQILKYKLGVLLSRASERTRAQLKPLDELSIKLENDLSRTTYLMQ